MRLHIITVGKIKDRALKEKVGEFLKRIRFEASIELVSIKDSDRQTEGNRLLQAIERFRRAEIFVLTEEGRQYTSRRFAERLRRIQGDAVFIIGGPDGLADCVKERADSLLSLSKMTFPHELSLVLLAEQLFRALTIIGGRNYHK